MLSVMIYDPKKPPEPPQQPRPSPRGNQSDGAPTMADRAGRCVQCGEPYAFGDAIIVNLATSRSGLLGDSDGWHPVCWEQTHVEG